ncbi:Uncharacterised protein [Serratia proteamaculans]|nr:Uncharacterised protein [Serratia proteamaculans]CAI2410171.1 Uncharacterised protein [Serratia proteamaculans]CAI2488757.1 Uncharacterised protein [Serratia proteamaculans]
MGHMPYSHFAVYNMVGALLRVFCSAICLSCRKT